MKQKVFSWGDKFTIKDEQGNDRYYVQGEVFSMGHKLHVYDTQSMEVAFIHQKVFSFRPRFFIDILGAPGELELVKKFTFLRQEYYIANSSYILEGNFSAHRYSLTSGGRVLMSVDKEWFTWGDSYVIDIGEGTDILMCICIMLAVDCANADASSSNHIGFSGEF
jgi:uncharacterized protein YxjI